MPQTIALQLANEQLEYLESYRALAEAAMGALALALSDRETTKQSCLEIQQMWQVKIDRLHAARLDRLQAVQVALHS